MQKGHLLDSKPRVWLYRHAVWLCVLSACGSHDECELGTAPCGEEPGTWESCDFAGDGHTLDFDPTNDGNYVFIELCPGIEPVCRPDGDQHICEDAAKLEPCPSAVPLLEVDFAVRRADFADFDDDGLLDALLVCVDARARPCGLWLARQRDAGGFGTLEEIGSYAADFNWLDVRTGNLDGEGGVDIVVLAASNLGPTLQPWFVRKDGLEAGATLELSSAAAVYKRTFDPDGDGKDEVIVLEGQTLTFFGADDELDAEIATAELPELPYLPKLTVIEDLYGDGRFVFVVHEYSQTGQAFVLRDGALEPITLTPEPTQLLFESLVVTDVSGDGATDLVFGSIYGLVVGVYRSNRDGSFELLVTQDLGYSATVWDYLIGDVDGDGDRDLVEPQGEGTLAVLLNAGDGSLAAPRYFSADGSTAAVQLADLDGDGRTELIDPRPSDDGTALMLIPGACL